MRTTPHQPASLFRHSWRTGLSAFAALALSLTVVACSSDDSPAPDNDVDVEISDGEIDLPDEASPEGDDEPDAAVGGTEAAQDGPPADFPLPDEYTLETGGSQGDAWTGVLVEIPDSVEELGAFYERELTAAGWDVVPDSGFLASEDDIGFAGTKDGWELQMGISDANGSTTILANIVPTE